MSIVAKVFVVFNFVMSIVFLTFAMNTWTAQAKWQKLYEREKTANVEQIARWQKDQIADKREIVKQQVIVERRVSEKATLQREKAALQDTLLDSQVKLATEKNAKDMAEAERQEVAREKDRVTQELIKLKGVLVKQQQAVIVERDNAARARAEKSEMENDLNIKSQQLAAVTKAKTLIEEDMAVANRRFETLIRKGYPIWTWLNEDVTASQPVIADAQLLAVKPDVGLVMLSVGSDQKVKTGYQFTVSRADTFIGKVQVENVYKDMCSAKIILVAPGAEFAVHDEARSR